MLADVRLICARLGFPKRTCNEINLRYSLYSSGCDSDFKVGKITRMIPIAINSYFLELKANPAVICAKLLLGTLASILVESV